MSNKSYSANEEDWGELENIMEDLECDYDAGAVVEIFEGDAVAFTHKEFIRGDRIIEDIQELAYDELGEWQQDYLDDLAEDKEKVKQLNELLIKFITDNSKEPSCYKVINVKKIKVMVGTTNY
jgi:hypothetical protein